MIDFSLPDNIKEQNQRLFMVASHFMRPIAREMDDKEHTKPWDFINMTWQVTSSQMKRRVKRLEKELAGEEVDKSGGNSFGTRGYMPLIYMIEMLSWGDAGIYLCLPTAALAGSAIDAVGTLEQKNRFLPRFSKGKPKWGAMAITEPHAGSDTSAIRTTATLDHETNEWILNGEKSFVTSGLMAAKDSDGILVVWATIDASAGRRGIKSFVIEANTPGMEVLKLEKKHGIRVSDTATIKLENCRIPYENILGNPEVQDKKEKKGFQGAMRTFDASRPLVAASAIGIGRAALEFTKEALEKEGITIRYNAPKHVLTSIERDFMDMEANLKAAWLLTLKATWMMDQRLPNTIESSMAKVKAGKAVTLVTQKAVELLGPLGYSCDDLIEKWMRDGKINDLYEGTGQINTLVVARRILGYDRNQLK
ncbi:MAG: acyl-CoA dehydrogenase [Anaerolineaceae bacterium 4572_78]|nr:MAG: acyl-CoA dehydrogenase [Anaerolineaceae bacterium 4572_78]